MKRVVLVPRICVYARSALVWPQPRQYHSLHVSFRSPQNPGTLIIADRAAFFCWLCGPLSFFNCLRGAYAKPTQNAPVRQNRLIRETEFIRYLPTPPTRQRGAQRTSYTRLRRGSLGACLGRSAAKAREEGGREVGAVGCKVFACMAA